NEPMHRKQRLDLPRQKRSVAATLALRGYRFRAFGQARGNPDRGAAAGDVAGHPRSGADPGKIADADVAENRGAGTEVDTPPDPGSAVGGFGHSSDGNVLQDGRLVADISESADHNPGG